jgi:ProP effector
MTMPAPSESPTPPAPRPGQLLSQLFPAAFGSPPAALKYGVHVELGKALDGILSAEVVSRFMYSHVRTTEYLTVVAAGGMRRTLAGEPVEAITAADQALAKQWLERRRLRKEGLLPPRWNGAFTLDYRGRAALLKEVKASGLRPGKYAAANGMDLHEFERNWNKAIVEQRERHARRAKLLIDFEQEAMSVEQFAAHHRLDAARVARDLDKARSYRHSAV